jgi:hypothetical protein
MVCAVSLIGCNRNASVKTDGSRDATKVADDNVPNNKRSLTGTWVSKDRQYELIVRDDGSASFGYRGGVMNSLSWKVSSTEGIILDYGDMRAGFKFRGNNDIDEAIYSSSNGTRYYTRQSSDGRAAREDKALDPIGVFNGVSPLGGTVRYRLDSDGTYTCFIQGGVRDEVTNGTWKLSGDSVSLTDRGATYAMRVTSRGRMSGSY